MLAEACKSRYPGIKYYVRDPDPSQVFEFISRNMTRNQTITTGGNYNNGKQTVMTLSGFAFITLEAYYKGKLIEVFVGNISY